MSLAHRIMAVVLWLLIFTSIFIFTLTSTTSHELKDCSNTLMQDAGTRNITILHETPFSSLPQRVYTKTHPEYRTIWYALNYTRWMIQSMNGDTTTKEDIYYQAQDLPHIDYYFEHNHYINTENMTLIRDCGGLRVWSNR